MNFLIGCCEKQPIRKLRQRLRSYEKENRSLIPAGDKVPISKIVAVSGSDRLIHQFVFRHADAVNLVLLRAGITLPFFRLTNIVLIWCFSE